MNIITNHKYWIQLKNLTTIKTMQTIESDKTELIFKVITEAEPDSRIIRSFI